MKAIVAPRYGGPDVLELANVDQPSIGDEDVLIRVHAVGLNAADWHLMRGEPYVMRLMAGLRRPKRPIVGLDVAGTVEAVGSEVTRFQPGDEVFGETGSAMAEYVAAKEKQLFSKPPNATFEQAAAIPVAAVTALQGLRDHGGMEKGQGVLINGASGGVGTFAIQIAKALGGEVTAVCSTRNLDQARRLGADRVIDYTDEDFTRRSEHFDLVLDCGGHRRLRHVRRVMKPKATCVIVGAGGMGNWIGPFIHLAKVKVASLAWSQKFTSMLARQTQDDLQALYDMVVAGEVTPVVEVAYPLAAAAEAMAVVDAGHARAKVVVTVP